jgi:hypothetical protein
VKTAIARKARRAAAADPAELEDALDGLQHLLKMRPEAVGEAIVRGIERRRGRLLIGLDAQAAAMVERLAPVKYWGLIRRVVEA